MYKTTSLRKTFVYLESNSKKDDVFVIIRIGNHTHHCNVFQALDLVCRDSNKFKWMQVV